MRSLRSDLVPLLEAWAMTESGAGGNCANPNVILGRVVLENQNLARISTG